MLLLSSSDEGTDTMSSAPEAALLVACQSLLISAWQSSPGKHSREYVAAIWTEISCEELAPWLWRLSSSVICPFGDLRRPGWNPGRVLKPENVVSWQWEPQSESRPVSCPGSSSKTRKGQVPPHWVFPLSRLLGAGKCSPVLGMAALY